jgi:membrane-bound serine protease (ClpP class)
MMSLPGARGVFLLIVAATVAVSAARPTLSASGADDQAPLVYAAEVDSVIHPVSAGFMIRTIEAADRANASLVVFTLRTPGGLVDSTRDIIAHMIAAKTPVAVFIGPSGGRAASAGFLLTIAADVAAMAPGTHIGAAHPVSGSGEQMDEEMSKKAAEDVAAYARTLAEARHRNVAFAEEAVRASRAFTETEALEASPPLIDLVVADVPALLQALDGRTVSRFDGTSAVLATKGARVVTETMTLPERILSTVAHPNIAYLLMSLGMLGLTIELWSPGAIVPGVVGGISLLLAFFALQLLPINIAGVLLILLGLLLFALEIKVTSYGMLTVGGAVSLLFGSLMLIDTGTPDLRVSLSVVLPVVAGFTAVAALLIRLGVASQRRRPITGMAGMVGEWGRVLTPIGADAVGRVEAHGEIWRARAEQPIDAGARVRVVAVDGLTLTVRTE